LKLDGLLSLDGSGGLIPFADLLVKVPFNFLFGISFWGNELMYSFL